ncbi:hypothetical protein M5D96_001838, partial [Drosophila gunungcola]
MINRAGHVLLLKLQLGHQLRLVRQGGLAVLPTKKISGCTSVAMF